MNIITSRVARVLVAVLAAVGLASATSASSASATPPNDLIYIPSTNLDFGDWGLLPAPLNDPVGFGVLEWDTSGGTVTPYLHGQLYINNSLGLHARMQISYYDVFGTWLQTKVGGEVYASSNALHTWNVSLRPYSNTAIYRVVIATTYKLGNTWYIKAQQTVYI